MNKRTYEQWLAAVDAECVKRIGLSYMDLPDINYGDLYEEGATPKRAASQAIKRANE